MNAMKYLLCGTCLFAVVLGSGCIVVSDSAGPVVVEEIEIGCAPPPQPATVIVTRPPRPSKSHVWIEGHHVVRSGTWIWIHGHWEKPARRHAVWARGHARRRGHVWIWTPGHWH